MVGLVEKAVTYLFKSLVVDKAGSILGYLQLTLLYLLAELPAFKTRFRYLGPNRARGKLQQGGIRRLT